MNTICITPHYLKLLLTYSDRLAIIVLNTTKVPAWFPRAVNSQPDSICTKLFIKEDDRVLIACMFTNLLADVHSNT